MNSVAESERAQLVNTVFVSVDDHVFEPPTLWTERLSASKWKDAIPHLKRNSDGSDSWVCGGTTSPLQDVAEVGAMLTSPAEGPRRWEDIPKTCSSAVERLQAMNVDGVNFSVLYPMLAGIGGQALAGTKDPALEVACVQAYNDWLVEEWGNASKRFVPQCLVPISSVEAAVKEIKRAAAKGHRGVIFPSNPPELAEVPHLNDEKYDPIWAICQELGLPVCFHAGASKKLQMEPYEGFSPKLKLAYQAITRSASNSLVMANMLMSKILFRFPTLKVVFSESSLGWLVFTLETQEHHFEQAKMHQQGYTLTPTELFQRQCFITGWYDDANLEHSCRHVGADRILWSSKFPLATSAWPNTRSKIRQCFAGLSESDSTKILNGNAAKLYRIEI